LRRIPGIKRPALTVVFPLSNRLKVLLDLGANADSKPEWLQQFAIMGSIYAENVLNIANPRVGLISNGEEDTKGNSLIQEAHKLIASSNLNFVGNIEPSDITHDNVDVAIMDGFVGNVFFKTFEASIRYMSQLLRDELTSGIVTQAGALLARPAFRRVRGKLNLEAYSGALLLGVEGVVVIGHGGADIAAVQGAIQQARQAVKHNIVESIKLSLMIIRQENDMDLLRNGRPRVVITGMSALSALGRLNDMWESLIHGQSGIGKLQNTKTDHLEVKIGGEVPDLIPQSISRRKMRAAW
jgi:glycerol-3-phosphate acyltransferase PlsX